MIIVITQRLDTEGNPFTELRITYEGRHYLSRQPYVIDNTPMSRAQEIAAFKRRQGIP